MVNGYTKRCDAEELEYLTFTWNLSSPEYILLKFRISSNQSNFFFFNVIAMNVVLSFMVFAALCILKLRWLMLFDVFER